MKIKNIDNNLENADWTKQSWDFSFKNLDGYWASQSLENATIDEQKKNLKHFMELPVYQSAPTTFKNEAEEFMSKETMADKALRSELKQKLQTQGVPSKLEVDRALSRLEILPNPNIADIDNPEKYVESPWQIVAVPTIDPNLWDNAVLDVLDLEILYGTDPYLSRKKVRKHIEAMGQALMPFRSYALVAVVGNRYTIIDGHHRLMAQWLLGQQQAPAWIIKLKEEN
jgi:hypothetical protein